MCEAVREERGEQDKDAGDEVDGDGHDLGADGSPA